MRRLAVILALAAHPALAQTSIVEETLAQIDGMSIGETLDASLVSRLQALANMQTANESAADAANLLFVLHDESLVSDANPEAADRYLRLAAKRGHTGGLLNFGTRHIASTDPKDRALATAYIRQAAERGVEEGLYIAPLALSYHYCTPGFERDPAKAREHLERCVELEAAQHLCPRLLADYYLSGEDGSNNPVRRYELYALAAEAGSTHALWQQGLALAQGVGVEADPAKAYALISRASEGGNAMATVSIAVMKMNGEGTDVDQAGAFAAYESVARDGTTRLDVRAHALRGLSIMQADGNLGEADPERAMAGFVIAHHAGAQTADAAALTTASRGEHGAPPQIFESFEDLEADVRTRFPGAIEALRQDYGFPEEPS